MDWKSAFKIFGNEIVVWLLYLVMFLGSFAWVSNLGFTFLIMKAIVFFEDEIAVAMT